MAQGSAHYPAVFVVDSHSSYPPMPPTIKRAPRSGKVAQTVLFFLVSVALFGMAIEACLIYQIYPRPAVNNTRGSPTVESPTASRRIGGYPAAPPPTIQPPNPVAVPSKPVAHLQARQMPTHGVKIMSWSKGSAFSEILHAMEYKDGKLVIQTEGYYYVYSKVAVHFTERNSFNHCVKVDTPRYPNKPIILLESRKHPGKGQVQSNSYLGGVFHLYENDSLFVEVSNASHILLSQSYFGAYMI